MPAGGRPKPSIARRENHPKVRAMYDYTAQDTDEIDLREGQILALIKEGAEHCQLDLLHCENFYMRVARYNAA